MSESAPDRPLGVTGLDHVTVSASDFAASFALYDEALSALGLERVVELGDEEQDGAAVEAAGWGTGADAVLWLVAAPVATRAVHICLRADSPSTVEAFHAAALAAGARSHDAPRRWPIFRSGRFNAIVQDRDGNLLEAVSAE
ncbi:MAG: VOC family protein [Jatrophihabitantaceae bacterium]